MDRKYELADEWKSMSNETKEMARKIIKSFAEKGFSICDAKEVLHACEVYVDFNSKIVEAG